MIKKVKCHKCGHIQYTKAIYGYFCNKKKGGCGRLIDINKARVGDE